MQATVTTDAPSSALTPNERSDYLRCKFRIKSGSEEAVRALEEVRERRLYRDEYGTFEAFCQAELGRTRHRIDQLITALPIQEEMRGIFPSVQTSDDMARELGKLPSLEQRAIVLSASMLVTPDRSPTVATVGSSATVLKAIADTSGHVNVGDGTSTPLGAAITHETHGRMQHQREHIKANSKSPIAVFEGVFAARDGDTTNVRMRINDLNEELWNMLHTGEVIRVVIYSAVNS